MIPLPSPAQFGTAATIFIVVVVVMLAAMTYRHLKNGQWRGDD